MSNGRADWFLRKRVIMSALVLHLINRLSLISKAKGISIFPTIHNSSKNEDISKDPGTSWDLINFKFLTVKLKISQYKLDK